MEEKPQMPKTVKVVPNPDLDFCFGYMGGFEDVPTKQDKFKPVSFKRVVGIDENNKEIELFDVYVSNNKAKEGQKIFEEKFISIIKNEIDDSHPYKKPLLLEVIVGINVSSKRLLSVDLDNLVKAILDCLNGLVYEDDSQIVSLIAGKHVIQDEFVPEISGVMIGVRKLGKDRPVIGSVPIYYMEYYDEDGNRM